MWLWMLITGFLIMGVDWAFYRLCGILIPWQEGKTTYLYQNRGSIETYICIQPDHTSPLLPLTTFLLTPSLSGPCVAYYLSSLPLSAPHPPLHPLPRH